MKLAYIIIPMLFMLGCTPEKSFDDKCRSTILDTLVSNCKLDKVNIPEGPFDLQKPYHTYYKAYVYATNKTFYIDVSPSIMWGLDHPNFHFYTKSAIGNFYYPIYK